MRRIDGAVAAGVLTLALVGAACASNGDDANAGAGAATGAATGSTGATGSSGGGGRYGYGSGGGGTTGSTGSGGGGTSVKTVTQVNYQFAPATFTVNAGDTITITDTNPSTPHTFTIAGTDIDVANDPMGSQDVTIDLAPGSYDFFCRFHKSQGMTGTLVVK